MPHQHATIGHLPAAAGEECRGSQRDRLPIHRLHFGIECAKVAIGMVEKLGRGHLLGALHGEFSPCLTGVALDAPHPNNVTSSGATARPIQTLPPAAGPEDLPWYHPD